MADKVRIKIALTQKQKEDLSRLSQATGKSEASLISEAWNQEAAVLPGLFVMSKQIFDHIALVAEDNWQMQHMDEQKSQLTLTASSLVASLVIVKNYTESSDASSVLVNFAQNNNLSQFNLKAVLPNDLAPDNLLKTFNKFELLLRHNPLQLSSSIPLKRLFDNAYENLLTTPADQFATICDVINSNR